MGLDDRRALQARAVVIACGVQYRGLPLERLRDFEGSGGFYAAMITSEQFGHVTQLTLARPEAANAISVEMALALSKAINAFAADPNSFVLRSEERRVGKECRFMWSTHQLD